MATDIKTVLKMDNSDIDAKLKLINKAVKESFDEWQNQSLKVQDANKKIIQLQKQLKTATDSQTESIKKQIKEQKELKREAQFAASANKRAISDLKYLENENYLINRKNKLTKESIRLQELAKAKFQTQGRLESKEQWSLNDAKEHYQQLEKESKKAFEVQEKDRLATIASREKEQEAMRATIAQRDREKASLKEEYSQLYLNTAAQNKYNSAKSKLDSMLKINAISKEQYNTALKKEEENLKKATKAQKTYKKEQSNLTNSLVRHLRQLETAIVAYYTLTRGFSATIGKGIQVNRMMEDNTMGIAALLSANTRMILSNGELVTSYDKFIMGQTVAKETMEELRKASVKTFATFPQLTEIFQQAIGQTLSMGNAFGSTTDEIIQNTIKLSQRMSNIGGAIGMPMDRIREEIRSMLSGNASTDSLISTMIFGSPGEANKAIRMAKERGKDGLTNMLNEVLKPFDAIEGIKTFSRSMLTLEDAYSNAMKKIVDESGAFKDIQNLMDKLAIDITKNSKTLIQNFDAIYTVTKTLVGGLGAIVSTVYDIGYAIGYGIAPYVQKIKDMTPKADIKSSNAQIEKVLPAQQKLNELLSQKANLERTINIYEKKGLDTARLRLELEKTISSLPSAKNNAEKEQASWEKTKTKLKATGELLTKYSIDLKIIEDLEKKRNRELDKELKIKQSIKDIDEVISKLELAKKNKNTAEEQKVFEDAILRAKREKKSLALDLNELYKERNEKYLKKEKKDQEELKKLEKEKLDIVRKREDFLFSAREKRASLITSEADKEKILLDIQHEKALVSLERQKKDMELAQENYNKELAYLEKRKKLMQLTPEEYNIELESLERKKEDIELTQENYKMALELEQELYEYQKYRLSDVGKLTETTTNALKSGMKDFFDITSDGFGDLGNLANNVLSQIISKMIEVQMVNPFVDAATPMLSDFIGSLFGKKPTKAYASGGLLTGGSGIRDDLYLGAASGSHVFAMGGEYIVNKNATNSVGKNTMDYINSTGKLPDTSGDNIKVEIINQTSSNIDSAEVLKSTKTNEKGEEEKILSVVLNGVATNKMNARTALKKLVG